MKLEPPSLLQRFLVLLISFFHMDATVFLFFCFLFFGGIIFVIKIWSAALFNSFTFHESLSLGCCGTFFIKKILSFNSFTFLLACHTDTAELLQSVKLHKLLHSINLLFEQACHADAEELVLLFQRHLLISLLLCHLTLLFFLPILGTDEKEFFEEIQPQVFLLFQRSYQKLFFNFSCPF